MMALTLLLASLELLEALHDCAIWKAFFVLHGRHSALLSHMLPPAGLVLVLSRINGELVATAVHDVLVVRSICFGLH